MKNKKLIIFSCIILVLTLSILVFAGCQNFSLAKLKNPDYDSQDYSLKVKTLNALSGYNYISIKEGFIALDKKDDKNQITEVILYNAESEKILLTLKEKFDVYTFEYYEGVALVKNTETNHIDVYDKNGVVFSSDNTALSSTMTNGYFRYLYFSNGKTVEIDIQNKAVTVKDTKIGGDPSNLVKYGDYYFESIGGESGFVLAVYDKNMNFKKYFDIESQINMTAADADATTSLLKNGKILINLALSLPDDTKSYDYINNGLKYDTRSYIIDLKSLSVSEVQPQYIITGMADESFSYNILYFQKITDKAVSPVLSLGVFDDDLKLLYNLSDHLSDIQSVEVLDNGDILLKNDDMAVVIDKKGNTVASYSLNGITSFGSFLLKENGDMKTIYDKHGKEIMTLDSNCELVSSVYSNKYIYYLQSTEVSGDNGSTVKEKTYMVYDIATRSAKELGKEDQIKFYSAINAYEISTPVDDAVLTSLYFAEDGKAIYEGNAYVNTTYYDNDNVLLIGTSEGSTTYYYFYR